MVGYHTGTERLARRPTLDFRYQSEWRVHAQPKHTLSLLQHAAHALHRRGRKRPEHCTTLGANPSCASVSVCVPALVSLCLCLSLSLALARSQAAATCYAGTMSTNSVRFSTLGLAGAALGPHPPRAMPELIGFKSDRGTTFPEN